MRGEGGRPHQVRKEAMLLGRVFVTSALLSLALACPQRPTKQTPHFSSPPSHASSITINSLPYYYRPEANPEPPLAVAARADPPEAFRWWARPNPKAALHPPQKRKINLPTDPPPEQTPLGGFLPRIAMASTPKRGPWESCGECRANQG